MVKGNNKTKLHILESGAEIIHRKGFNNTGLQEILKAANVPKGSFYFYFNSKNDFGLQLLDFFDGHFTGQLDAAMQLPEVGNLEKLRMFFAGFLEYFKSVNFERGCPVGNMGQEMADLDEAFREKTERVWNKMRDKILEVLQLAVSAGELPEDRDVSALAEFILNSWEGALIRVKVTKSEAPLVLFEQMIFNTVLK